MEFLLQTEWPQLRVFLDSRDGPLVRGRAERSLVAGRAGAPVRLDISNQAVPLMAMQEGRVAGIAARVMRISFSGELSFEVNVAADSGEALWTALLEAGRPHGLTVYGTEAMSGLRIEKGHPVVGAEIDGRTTPGRTSVWASWSGAVVTSSAAVRSRSRRRRPGPAVSWWELAGEAGGDEFPPGGHVVAANRGGAPQPALGPVTSWGWSPTLDRMIGLALLEDGRTHFGKTMFVDAPVVGRTLPVTITHPLFYDPDGARLRG